MGSDREAMRNGHRLYGKCISSKVRLATSGNPAFSAHPVGHLQAAKCEECRHRCLAASSPFAAIGWKRCFFSRWPNHAASRSLGPELEHASEGCHPLGGDL